MKILKWSAITLATVFFILLAHSMIHVFNSAKIAAARSQALSNVKSTSYAIFIYSTDFDDRLPNATSMPTLRAQTKSYTGENGDIHWKSDIDFLANTFNFNLSGVKIASIAPIDSDQVEHVLLYRIPRGNAHRPMVARLDTSTKSMKIEQLLQSLQIQYNRTDITLAPADYLAEQDPQTKNPSSPVNDSGKK